MTTEMKIRVSRVGEERKFIPFKEGETIREIFKRERINPFPEGGYELWCGREETSNAIEDWENFIPQDGDCFCIMPPIHGTPSTWGMRLHKQGTITIEVKGAALAEAIHAFEEKVYEKQNEAIKGNHTHLFRYVAGMIRKLHLLQYAAGERSKTGYGFSVFTLPCDCKEGEGCKQKN